MKFTHFSHVCMKPGMTPHQRYEQLWRELQLCDVLDYDYYGFCVEHHFTQYAEISVQPMQKPHPNVWMQSRDPATLEVCAKNGINAGYFIVYPRNEAALRYAKIYENWKRAGWNRKPNIAMVLPEISH